MHEMEIQLHYAKETLAKYVHENEVFNLQFPLKMNVWMFFKDTLEE